MNYRELAKQYYDYMTFRAAEEGPPHDLSVGCYEGLLRAGTTNIFGVKHDGERLTGDKQRPEIYMKWMQTYMKTNRKNLMKEYGLSSDEADRVAELVETMLSEDHDEMPVILPNLRGLEEGLTPDTCDVVCVRFVRALALVKPVYKDWLPTDDEVHEFYGPEGSDDEEPDGAGGQ